MGKPPIPGSPAKPDLVLNLPRERLDHHSRVAARFGHWSFLVAGRGRAILPVLAAGGVPVSAAHPNTCLRFAHRGKPNRANPPQSIRISAGSVRPDRVAHGRAGSGRIAGPHRHRTRRAVVSGTMDRILHASRPQCHRSSVPAETRVRGGRPSGTDHRLYGARLPLRGG